MGQAKRRGTYYERKKLSIEKYQLYLSEQKRIRAERQLIEDHEAGMREAAMTPEEKMKRRKIVPIAATLISIAAILSTK